MRLVTFIVLALAGCKLSVAGPDAPAAHASPPVAAAAVRAERPTPTYLDPAQWSAWDVDRDDALDRREFRRGAEASGWFGDWDADRSGRLSRDELQTGLFGAFDADGDGRLDAWEVKRGAAFWLPTVAVPTWSSWEGWDRNRDGYLDHREFQASFAHRWNAWDVDGDGAWSVSELQEGARTAWDLDQDGIVDPFESRWH